MVSSSVVVLVGAVWRVVTGRGGAGLVAHSSSSSIPAQPAASTTMTTMVVTSGGRIGGPFGQRVVRLVVNANTANPKGTADTNLCILLGCPHV